MPAHLIAEEGPHRGLILNLEDGEEWIIGRDPDEVDFVIEDSTVSRKHARLTKTPDGIYLKNLSKVNPTLVGDEEHKELILLKEGDRIQIGNTVFLYSEEELPQLNAKPKKPKSGYDDIFGDLSTEDPPVPMPKEASPLPSPKESQEEPEESNVYDTIFEDSEGEEEIPFNLISESPLMLKVISGPNAGAEISIEKGRSYILGKDPNSCDIVFQDMSVSREHAELFVNEEGDMEIADLGSKNGTVVNGTPIAEKTVITTQDLLALGTTAFLMINRELPQETIYSALAPTYETPKIESPSEEASDVEEKVARDWKRDPIPMRHLVAAGSFLLVFLIVFLSFFSLFKSKGIEMVQKEPVDEIKEALAKFKDIQFSYNPGSGKLFVVGHVLTGIEFQEMNYRLSQIPFIHAVEDNVVIDELVSKTMNDVLSENASWQGISIQAMEPGQFSVMGYIQTSAEASALSNYLSVNFPYLDRLQNRVAVEEILNAELQSMLASGQFGGVTFQLSNGTVVLNGRYSNLMDKQYDGFLKELQKVHGIRSVQNFAIASDPKAAGIDISGQYQVTGSSLYDGRGYSVVLNGKIYTLGDSVDGLKITAIESNTILLEKDGLKYKIDYAGRG